MNISNYLTSHRFLSRRLTAMANGACLNSSKLPVAGVGAVANNELDGHAD